MRSKWMRILEVQQNNRTSFPRHNEMMKEFRRLHGRVATVNPTGINEHGFLAITGPLAIRGTNVDSGGACLSEPHASWLTFLSLPKVASYKLSPN